MPLGMQLLVGSPQGRFLRGRARLRTVQKSLMRRPCFQFGNLVQEKGNCGPRLGEFVSKCLVAETWHMRPNRAKAKKIPIGKGVRVRAVARLQSKSKRGDKQIDSSHTDAVTLQSPRKTILSNLNIPIYSHRSSSPSSFTRIITQKTHHSIKFSLKVPVGEFLNKTPGFYSSPEH